MSKVTMKVGAAVLFALLAYMFTKHYLVPSRVHTATEKASELKIDADMKAILFAAAHYEEALGKKPQTVSDLLNARDKEGNVIPGSLSVLPNDPWGNPYVLTVEEGQLALICYGKDGRAGGTGDDRDRRFP